MRAETRRWSVTLFHISRVCVPGWLRGLATLQGHMFPSDHKSAAYYFGGCKYILAHCQMSNSGIHKWESTVVGLNISSKYPSNVSFSRKGMQVILSEVSCGPAFHELSFFWVFKQTCELAEFPVQVSHADSQKLWNFSKVLQLCGKWQSSDSQQACLAPSTRWWLWLNINSHFTLFFSTLWAQIKCVISGFISFN